MPWASHPERARCSQQSFPPVALGGEEIRGEPLDVELGEGVLREGGDLAGEGRVVGGAGGDGAGDDVLDEAAEKPGKVEVFFFHLVPEAVGGAVDGRAIAEVAGGGGDFIR